MHCYIITVIVTRTRGHSECSRSISRDPLICICVCAVSKQIELLVLLSLATRKRAYSSHLFYRFLAVPTRGSNSDCTVTTLRYNLYARSHKPHTTSLNFHITRARMRSRRGTLSKMASFRAETRDFHSRCGIGEERSLGDDAHL